MSQTELHVELNKLEAELDAELRQLESHRRSTFIVGIVLMLGISGYFFFMSWKVEGLMDPEGLAVMASQRVVTFLPEARVQLEASARKEVPKLVDDLITTSIKQVIPAAHARLKAHVLRVADAAMDEGENAFFTQVDDQLREHGDSLRNLAANLGTTEGTSAFEEAVYTTLEGVAEDPHVKVDLLGYGAAMQELDGTVAYLAQDKIALTPEEESARNLISISRELLNRARRTPSTPVVGIEALPAAAAVPETKS